MYKMATSVGANLLLSVDIPQYSIIVRKEHQQRWRVMPQIDSDASYYAGRLTVYLANSDLKLLW